jgi:flagellar biosynthesis protein
MTDTPTDRIVSLAVALHYDEVNAPRVTAKGSGDIAQQILEVARRNNVPLQENAELVKVLSKIELGEQIPQALYLAVAEVIAFAYLLKGKAPRNWRPETKP